jgi:hypothetical protein
MKNGKVSFVVAALLAMLCATHIDAATRHGPFSALAGQVVVLKAARMYDPVAGRLVPDAVVVIREDKIVEVGTTRQFLRARGCRPRQGNDDARNDRHARSPRRRWPDPCRAGGVCTCERSIGSERGLYDTSRHGFAGAGFSL